MKTVESIPIKGLLAFILSTAGQLISVNEQPLNILIPKIVFTVWKEAFDKEEQSLNAWLPIVPRDFGNDISFNCEQRLNA